MLKKLIEKFKQRARNRKERAAVEAHLANFKNGSFNEVLVHYLSVKKAPPVTLIVVPEGFIGQVQINEDGKVTNIVLPEKPKTVVYEPAYGPVVRHV